MEAKIIQKYNNRSTTWLKTKAQEYFNKFIRLRDTDDNGYGYCISSGKLVKYGTNYCHAGHFYAAGSYPWIRFDEDNVHVQSMSDNYFGHSCGAEYSANLSEKIGYERIYNLGMRAKLGKKTKYKEDRFLYIEVIEKYKAKCKILLKTKMF